MLNAAQIAQIDNALHLLRDESGQGEVVLKMVNGEILNFVERRPVIRMVITDRSPPAPKIIPTLHTTG